MRVFAAFMQLVYVSASVSQMSLVREWDSVHLLVPGEGGQETSRSLDQDYDESRCIANYWLLDVYKDRLFVSISLTSAPEFSLAYHNLSDTLKSLLLHPYPSRDAQSDEHGDRQIHEVVALRVDHCDRLWVIDKFIDIVKHQLIVFDLNTDRILRKHTFRHSIYAPYYMVIDDDDCENPYLYISDRKRGGIWTYSWAEDTMWYHPGSFVAVMIIAPNKSDSSIVYYNKFRDSGVWYISTRYLKDKTGNDLSELHQRGEHSVFLELTALDAKNNVLFAITSDKSIRVYPCWNRYEWCDPSGWHDIDVSTTPKLNNIILDKNGNLWAFAYRYTAAETLDNLSIFSIAITSVNAELNKIDTTNTTKLNETATPATDPASSTAVQASDVDYDGINNTTVTIEETIASTPNSGITATDPASSTIEQASGVDYNGSSNTTVTIEDITGGTPNITITATDPVSSTTEQASGVDYNGSSNTTVTIEDITGGTPNITITATDPVSSTTEQASGVDYNGSSNTTVTTEETLAVTPNSTITATDPVSSTKMQASGVNYDRISNTIATAEDTIVVTPNIDINTQANGGTKLTQFANILFSFTNSSLIFSNFTVNYFPSNNVN